MDSNTILDTVNTYVPDLVLLVLGINMVFCFIYRTKLTTPFRWLFYFLIWNFIIEVLALVFMKLGMNNLPLLHIYTLGEFILFSFFYKSLLHKPVVLKKVFPYLVGAIVLLIVLNSVFIQSIYTFNTYAKSAVQIIIIGFAILYFYNLIENRSLSQKKAKGLRLVNSAVIIYYSGSLFVFMYGFSIDVSKPYIMLWAFNATLNLIFQLLILKGLWKAYFKRRIL